MPVLYERSRTEADTGDELQKKHPKTMKTNRKKLSHDLHEGVEHSLKPIWGTSFQGLHCTS